MEIVFHDIITGIYLIKEKREKVIIALMSWFNPAGNHHAVILTSPPAAQPA